MKNGLLVKTINLEGLRQIGPCKDYALKYMKDNVDEIFLSDPVASLYEREPLFQLLDSITDDLFIPITISGGIKNVNHIRKLMLIGADKVAINTEAIKNPEFINKAVSIYGSQSVAISIQTKKVGNEWFCFTNCGRDNSGKLLENWICEAEKRGAGEIIITSVSNEGMMKGLDIELIEKANNLINLPITYSGGFGSLNHLNFLRDKNTCLSGLAISGALHYNKYSVNQIRTYLKENNISIRNL